MIWRRQRAKKNKQERCQMGTVAPTPIHADWEKNLVIVNISGIRQYYSTDPVLVRLCRLTKSHQLELLISSTGCCACCSVVAVICVRLLVYQDYAATSTGVGNRQMSERHKQTQCVFIWSVLLLEFPNLNQIASRDNKKKRKRKKVEACF